MKPPNATAKQGLKESNMNAMNNMGGTMKEMPMPSVVDKENAHPNVQGMSAAQGLDQFIGK